MYTYQLAYCNQAGKIIATHQNAVKQHLYLTAPPKDATHYQLTQIVLPRQLEPVPSGFYGVERVEE